MFERFDEQARLSVVLAQEEARGLRHDYIGAQHLLLGVIRADAELAAVAPETVRAMLEPGDGESPEQMPFSSVAKRALEQALREAMALGHRQINPAHILLALASERAVRELLDRADAGPLVDRDRTTARAHAVAVSGAAPAGAPSGDPAPRQVGLGTPAGDARIVGMILDADGPVAGLLRERGVDYAALQPFLDE